MEAIMVTKHTWQADKYHAHSSIQYNAAMNLLNHINLKNDAKILDVGCGDGKITAMIASLVPNGSVIGIDQSPEMIAFAQKEFASDTYPNLRFLVQDGQHLNYSEKFDVLFSSFALQWIPDKHAFFKGAYNSLCPSGTLAITIPLGASLALEQAIAEITSLPEFARYFQNFSSGWHIINETAFSQLLATYKFLPTKLTVTPLDVTFHLKADFENYILPWFSYLDPLPIYLKMPFFEKIINRYLEIEPISKNGIHLKFDRLDILAKKT